MTMMLGGKARRGGKRDGNGKTGSFARPGRMGALPPNPQSISIQKKQHLCVFTPNALQVIFLVLSGVIAENSSNVLWS